jgi:hypothetical protein
MRRLYHRQVTAGHNHQLLRRIYHRQVTAGHSHQLLMRIYQRQATVACHPAVQKTTTDREQLAVTISY